MPKYQERSVFSGLGREFLAEVLGTAILMLLGLSGCACFVLKGIDTPFGAAFGFCFGAIIACFFCGPISGAQINPAFTFAFTTIGKTPWNKCLVYVLAQYIGSFIGSAMVYGLYYQSIAVFELNSGLNSTSAKGASIFITAPAEGISLWVATMDQVVSTALLCFAVLFITDDKCFRTPDAVKFLTVGLTIMSFVVAFGFNSGAILNPARDLAPRILLSMVGYQSLPFQAMNYQFWWAAGILGPHVGAVIGAVLYRLLNKLRDEAKPEDDSTGTATIGGDGTAGSLSSAITLDGHQRKQVQMINQIMAAQITNNGGSGHEQDLIYQKELDQSSNLKYRPGGGGSTSLDQTASSLNGSKNNKFVSNSASSTGGSLSIGQRSFNGLRPPPTYTNYESTVLSSSLEPVGPSTTALASGATAVCCSSMEPTSEPPKKFIFFKDLPDLSPPRTMDSTKAPPPPPSSSSQSLSSSVTNFLFGRWLRK